MNKMKVPDIYIVGAQKSGTTTLYDWLAQHPKVYGHPLAKDYPYFSNDRTHTEGSNIFYSFVKSAADGQLVLGGDVNALYVPLGPQRMYNMMPNAKLIAVLRHPVERVYSAYSYAVERLLEDRSLEQAIHDELGGEGYEPGDTLQRDYLGHGKYALQLDRVFQFFKPEQVKVVFFEELKQNPIGVVDDVFHFMGVPHGFSPIMEIKNQTKGGYRSQFLAKVIAASPSSNKVRKLGQLFFPYSLRTAIRRKLVAINRVERPKPEFPDHVRQLLKEYYRDEILGLESLLGHDIPIWREY